MMLHLFVRSLTMAAVGVLLLLLREQAMPFIVMCIGVLFVLPAIFTLAVAFIPAFKRSGGFSNAVVVPIISLGSLLLGLWMFLDPGFFVKIIMWVLGAVMVVIGVFQTIELLIAKKNTHVSSFLFVLPILLFVTGIIVIANPFEAAAVPFTILGIGAVVAAVSDVLNTMMIKFPGKKNKEQDVDDVIELIDK